MINIYKKVKLPGIFAIAIVFGFFFWLADAFINSFFKISRNFDVIWDTFIVDIKSTPDIYSRLIAIVLLIVLGLISLINRKQITFQNYKLNILKSELEKTNRKLRKFLFKDYLTGAINRKPFIDLIDSKISDAGRNNTRFALLFIDLAKFKNLNDTFGHDFGDKVLIHTSWTLNANIRKSDFLGRYGGDEFVVGLNNIKSKDDIKRVVKKIIKAFDETIEIEGIKTLIELNIGIAVYPEDGKSTNDLLRNSDNAMYKAKKNNMLYEFFSDKKL